MRAHSVGSVSFSLLGVVLPAVALADPPLLELSAPGHCPTPAEFESFVAARLPSTSASAPGGRFAVEVAIVGDRHVATLSTTSSSGDVSLRTLEDPSCVELLKSVAFVIAVAVEREREELERKRAAAPPATLAAPGPASLEASKASSPARDTPPKTPGSAAPPPSNARLSLLAGVRGTAAPTPEFAPAARLGGAVWFTGVAPTFSVHVSGLRTLPQSVSVDTVDPERGASFTWTAASVEGCAGTAHAGAQVALSGCLGAELGQLSAHGEGVTPDHTRDRFWFSAIALGRLRFPAETAFGLELDAGAVIPLTRDRFVIEGPKTRVFQPPWAAFSLGLGLSLRVL